MGHYACDGAPDVGVMVMELNDGSLYSVDAPIGFQESTDTGCVWHEQMFNFQTYDRGAFPRVSCQSGTLTGRSGAQGVEVHQASSSSSTVALWSRTFTGQ